MRGRRMGGRQAIRAIGPDAGAERAPWRLRAIEAALAQYRHDMFGEVFVGAGRDELVQQEAIDAGSGGAYFPVIAKHIDQ